MTRSAAVGSSQLTAGRPRDLCTSPSAPPCSNFRHRRRRLAQGDAHALSCRCHRHPLAYYQPQDRRPTQLSAAHSEGLRHPDFFAGQLTGSCTASGSGNINDTVNVPAGGNVTYTLQATISPSATGSLSNTATVTAPNGVTDVNPANNSSTDTDAIVASAAGIPALDGLGLTLLVLALAALGVLVARRARHS
jgi:hypothetical protein